MPQQLRILILSTKVATELTPPVNEVKWKKEVCLNLSPRMLYRRVSRSFKTRVIRNHNYFLSTVIVYAIRCIACRVQGCQKKGPHDVTLLPLSLYSYVLRLCASRRDNGNVVGPPTSNRIEQRVHATRKVE